MSIHIEFCLLDDDFLARSGADDKCGGGALTEIMCCRSSLFPAESVVSMDSIGA